MRILVAEDEPASAEGLRALLELIGHQVVGLAADGAEAVRLAGREHPDLAIFDIDMPKLSGLEAIDRISQTRPIPVILLTAHTEPEYLDRAAELPVFNFLTKPAGAEALIPAIRIARARFEEWSTLNGRVGELSGKMEERKLVERAKGILMKARGVSEDDAYQLLRRESQQRSRPMVQVARSVIAAEGLLTRAAATRDAG